MASIGPENTNYENDDHNIFFKSNKLNGFEWLSNFYPAPFHLDGYDFPSVEHYYQAVKYLQLGCTEQFRAIQTAPTALAALELNRAFKDHFPNTAWTVEASAEAMGKALRAKFRQNAPLRQRLIDTGDKILHESPGHIYSVWTEHGDGKSNLLGLKLMEVREELLLDKAVE